MKKFLALLFVCAGLTAMAAPHVNKADLNQANKGQMVMKANSMSNQLTAGVSKSFMEAAKKDVQRHSAQNLVTKRAPQRLTADEIINMPYVCFLYACTYNDNNELVEQDPYYAGSGAFWYPDTSDGLNFAGFYWDEEGSTYYLPIDVNFETGDVALSWGLLLVDDTTSTNPGARNRTDTIRWHAILSEDYYLNQQQNNCLGHMYEDGSIIFEDNYVYYREMTLEEYKNGSKISSTTTSENTVFVGTEILAANGNLTFTREYDGKASNSYVYMFQNEAADSLYIGNMYNYGMPNVAMTISADAKMNYNCVAEVSEEGTTYLDNPVWDLPDDQIQGGLGYAYGFGELTYNAEGQIEDIIWGFQGDVTKQEITWPYAGASNGYHIYYGFNNNVLTWLNGGEFRLPEGGPVYTPGDVDNDGEVAIADVAVLIDALLSGELDDTDTFNSLAADFDGDGEIAIADVAGLVDYLLTAE
jgi:hypothetical protein